MSSKLKFILIIITSAILFGCSHLSKPGISHAEVDAENNELSLNGDTTNSCQLTITINENLKYEKTLKGGERYSFLELLRENPDYYNNIAYQLATHDGNIIMGLKIPNICDTVINFRHNTSDAYQHTCEVTSGLCAPLSNAFSKSNVETDIIKWLYRSSYNNLSDTIIDNIRLYIQDLKRSIYKEYTSKKEIPIVQSLKGISYNLSSALRADYYYLFACQSEQEIEDFVEEVISLKFEGASRSLSEPLICYRSPTSIGMVCLMLIGIDSNWSYQIVPVGLLSIDNCPPLIENSSNNPTTNSSNKFIFQKNRILISTDSPIPDITGQLSIEFGKFQGHGHMLSVPFTFNFSGDIDKIAVHRTKSLIEEIDLSDKISPYHITLDIGLNTGDNYIPIDAFDRRGNKASYDLKISTERVKEDRVIENNITIK